MKHSILCALSLGLLGCFAAPVYQGPQSDHFDGEEFQNRIPSEKGLSDVPKMLWQSFFDQKEWPEWIKNDPYPAPQSSLQSNQIQITFINHASFLIQTPELTILTDPIYSERASIVTWAGPKRVREPGVPLEKLPQIDVILISHNHYDHLDEETLIQLRDRQPNNPPLILSGLGNSGLYEEIGLTHFKDLDWGESHEVKGVSFYFEECRHRSGRGISDQMKTLWGSFVIQTSQGNIYFAGDTGYSDHFERTQTKYGDFAISLLPIGAYEPRWFMKEVHLNPEEAVKAHMDLKSRYSIGMHFGTYQLTFEAINDPAQDLATALEKYDVPQAQFEVLGFGESKVIDTTF